MASMSDAIENFTVDGKWRGGALNGSGTVNSTAVVTGVWTASTAYTLGQIVVPHVNMTGAGGKFLRCTTAGTSGAVNTLAVPAVGSTLTDNTATWTAVSGMPSLLTAYFGLITCTNGTRANSTAYLLNNTLVVLANDSKYHYYKVTTAGTTAAAQSTLYPGTANEAITDGTAVLTEQQSAMDANTAQVEVTGGSYARVAYTCSLANWAGTQAAASTTASTGTSGTTSNNAVITFPTPSAAWAAGTMQVCGMFLSDLLTGGTIYETVILTAPKTINATDPAPSFAAGTFTLQVDN